MKQHSVYSETQTEFLNIIYMNSCSKMLRPGLVLHKNKKQKQKTKKTCNYIS